MFCIRVNGGLAILLTHGFHKQETHKSGMENEPRHDPVKGREN